ncbi:hypothetical protein [Bradyrhizobium sp. 170]|uniref:hypothetical protein n=1 Tax=Bradyrhizobium sp. 170 TaxID=2782641 RepID=UPI001FFECC73|nr:hypothetical protein [Bradyrhizobium sp. 170]UPK04039.1 hypothetical protein IVB05_42365 [Bradyrhizobium sp. 170]
MIPVIAAIFLVYFTVPSFAQAQSAQAATPQSSTTAARKSQPKARTVARSFESGPCQIGVIPIAGNLFLVEKFGPFTFTDTYDRVAVDGWALDDLVVSRVRAAAPGMSVRRIPFTKEELANHPKPAWHFGRDTNIREFAQYVARGMNCERYVLVHRHGGNQREFGIGISKHYLGRHANLFAMMYIRVYDGRTFELIKEAPAMMTENTYLERVLHNPLGGPSRELDLAMFPERPADVAANPVLRDGVRAMLTASLDKTLPGMLRRPAQEAAR